MEVHCPSVSKAGRSAKANERDGGNAVRTFTYIDSRSSKFLRTILTTTMPWELNLC